MTENKAIFLDRDGTLIVDKIYLNRLDEIEYLPGTFEALKIFRDLGYLLIVVTNQSGLARGIVQIEKLHLIHEQIQADAHRHGIRFSGFFHAPYTAAVPHPRRKPFAGLLFEAAQDFRIDLRTSWMIGDRETDVLAGLRAHCQTALIDPKVECPKKGGQVFFSPDHAGPLQYEPHITVPSLYEAAHWIRKEHEEQSHSDKDSSLR